MNSQKFLFLCIFFKLLICVKTKEILFKFHSELKRKHSVYRKTMTIFNGFTDAIILKKYVQWVYPYKLFITVLWEYFTRDLLFWEYFTRDLLFKAILLGTYFSESHPFFLKAFDLFQVILFPHWQKVFFDSHCGLCLHFHSLWFVLRSVDDLACQDVNEGDIGDCGHLRHDGNLSWRDTAGTPKPTIFF